MIQQLFEKLQREKLMLASAESLTGGLFAASITAVPGASQVFKGGVITYSDQAKISLGVKSETIEEFGAVSSECAKEMALKCSEHFFSDVAVSFTGNAGPAPSEGKPVGLVFITIVIGKRRFSFKLNLDGDRAMIREQCVNFAIETLCKKLDLLYPEGEEAATGEVAAEKE